MNRFEWLDNIGRKKKPKVDAISENFMTTIQRLTLVHENPDNGQTETFKFGRGPEPDEGGGKNTWEYSKQAKTSEKQQMADGFR